MSIRSTRPWTSPGLRLRRRRVGSGATSLVAGGTVGLVAGGTVGPVGATLRA